MSTLRGTAQASADAHASARSHRTAAAICQAFCARWQEADRDDLATVSTVSQAALSEAIEQRKELADVQQTHRTDARQARDRARTARENGRIADQRAADAAALVDIVSMAQVAEATRPSAQAAHTDAVRRIENAQNDYATATNRIQSSLETAARARSDRTNWQRDRNNLGVERAAQDPGGNLSVVEATWRTLRDELSTAEKGLVEAEHLKRAQRKLADALSRRDRFDNDVLDRAAELSTTIMASSRESLSNAQRQAKTDASNAEKARLRAEHLRERAEADVRGATPPSGDRVNHFDLANAPRWQPSAPSHIPDLLEELEEYNEEIRAKRDEAEKNERDAIELRNAVEADITAFGDTIGMWLAESAPVERRFEGTKAAAREQMLTLVKNLRDAEAAERRVTGDLRDAITAVHSAAADARWRDLDTPAAMRVRSLPDNDLVAESESLGRRVRAMGVSAAGDLAKLDEHRTILRDNLVALCREQRRLLREVSRASKLPHGLGEISEQPAIKIRFDDAPDDEAAVRLADRIDMWAGELAVNPKRAGSAEVRARWLAEAVRETVVDRARAGAWSIEILKPRIDGRTVYCPPERIPREFSGGQVLTLAVLVSARSRVCAAPTAPAAPAHRAR